MSLRAAFIYIDKLLTGGRLLRRWVVFRVNRLIRHRVCTINYGYSVQYQQSRKNPLNILFEKYGSDKGGLATSTHHFAWPCHNYADFYHMAFGLRRREVRLVIECGIGTNNPELVSTMGSSGKPGASLRAWRDYFPGARIIGCDIDDNILFSEDRISTYQCDQTSIVSIKQFQSNARIRNNEVDLIIDDGLHEFEAGKCFFENMIGLLGEDGLYVIEDVTHVDIVKYKDYFSEKGSTYDAAYIYLTTPQRNIGGDNNIIVIRKTL